MTCIFYRFVLVYFTDNTLRLLFSQFTVSIYYLYIYNIYKRTLTLQVFYKSTNVQTKKVTTYLLSNNPNSKDRK